MTGMARSSVLVMVSFLIQIFSMHIIFNLQELCAEDQLNTTENTKGGRRRHVLKLFYINRHCCTV